MRTSSWIKAIVGGGGMMLGGPIVMYYVTPTEEELFKRYNPDLQRRSLEGREERLKEANEFIDKLKEYSKDSRPIWTVWKEDAMRQKKEQRKKEAEAVAEKKSIAEEIRRQRLEDQNNSNG